jgi:hypothetical protein
MLVSPSITPAPLQPSTPTTYMEGCVACNLLCICAAQSSQITRNMGRHQQAAPRTSPPAALSLRARVHSDLVDVVREWRAVLCLCSLSPRLPCQHGRGLSLHAPSLPQRKEKKSENKRAHLDQATPHPTHRVFRADGSSCRSFFTCVASMAAAVGWRCAFDLALSKEVETLQKAKASVCVLPYRA